MMYSTTQKFQIDMPRMWPKQRLGKITL